MKKKKKKVKQRRNERRPIQPNWSNYFSPSIADPMAKVAFPWYIFCCPSRKP